MTLLVGILCEGGAVIAADRQASHGALGTTTVGHETPKIRKLSDTILFAASGPVGLGQHLAHLVSSNATLVAQNPYFGALPQLQQTVRSVLFQAIMGAQQAQGIVGTQAAASEALCSCLLAAVFQDGLKLIEISTQGGFEYLTHDVPFVCVGSGKANADPFIKFLWSVYWGNGQRPSVQGAALTAYWTVKATIDAHTSGVGYSPDVAIIQEDGAGGYVVTECSEDELAEHNDFIDQAHEALKGIRDKILDSSQDSVDEVAKDPPPILDAPTSISRIGSDAS